MNVVREKVELAFGKIELLDGGILTFAAFSHLETVTLQQLQELLDALVEITQGNPMPFFADNSNMKSLGLKERKYIGDNLHLFATASAVKENSTSIRFIGNAINHLFPPKVPMRMFKSEKEAFAWLRSLK